MTPRWSTCCECGVRIQGFAERCRPCNDTVVVTGIPLRVLARIVEVDGCWLYQGADNGAGYRIIKVGTRRGGAKRRNVYVHRLIFAAYYGRIPEGMELDHRCRSRACVNPAHLDLVTHRENILRGTSPSAHQAAQTHCKRGHLFDDANTIVSGRKRRCRICNREWRAARAAPAVPDLRWADRG